jgi:hypothetical protein
MKAMDEKSGMNFSEYIAILSGDTTLLEKTKLEKKIAVMESLKTAHLKEIVRHYQAWKPKTNSENPKELGELYGFKLYIRHEVSLTNLDGKAINNAYNSMYAERPDGSIRYTFSSGAPNTDNPKLAARYFINAIDKVDGLVEKYQKELREIAEQIPQLKALQGKAFGKEAELQSMKSELSRLEREIAQNIKAKQEAQNEQQVEQIVPDAHENKSLPEINADGSTVKSANGPKSNTAHQSQAGAPAENPVLERTRQAIYAQHPEMANAKKAKGVRL